MGTFVNVLGAERTGSTMMDVVLGNDETAFSCGEVMYWFRPYREHNFSLDCSCGDKNCRHLDLYRGGTQSKFHNSILKKYAFSIDSSKNLVWVIDNLSYVGKQHRVVNIVMWKRLETLIYSHWKRKNDIEKYVTSYFDYYAKLVEADIPFVSVNYDDFVKNPQPTLLKLCQLLEMEYSDAKLNFWEGDHHFLFGSHGIRQQVQARASHIYKNEGASEEFDHFLKNCDLKFLDKLPVDRIFDLLEKNDILTINGAIHIDHSEVKVKKPYWYYIRRFRRMLRKYFPAKYEVKNVNHLYGRVD